MKCPHCQEVFRESWTLANLSGPWRAKDTTCPGCRKETIVLERMTSTGGWGREFTVWPQGASRPLPAEVEASFAEDFSEAVAVLGVSPKASAALSRRLLQRLLEEKAGVSHGDLYGEIQQVLDSGELPSWLGNDLDAVRQLGNLAAHPMKSTHTGEIQDVDPGEAEWLLDVMESLFDFYFVGPAKAQAKRDALNEKLAEVNKPPLRTQSP